MSSTIVCKALVKTACLNYIEASKKQQEIEIEEHIQQRIAQMVWKCNKTREKAIKSLDDNWNWNSSWSYAHRRVDNARDQVKGLLHLTDIAFGDTIEVSDDLAWIINKFKGE